MGVGMDLEFDKYCKVDESPRTVLKASHHNAKPESKSRKSKSSARNSQASLEAGFREIKFRNYHRSVSCKTLPTQSNELAIDREVLKRGSVYQSSNERNSFKKPDGVGGRKKIELSLNGDSPFSFSLLDSICGSDEDDERPAERDLMEESSSKFKSSDVAGPSSTANVLKEGDNQALSKSLSAKLALPHSPARSYSSSASQLTPSMKLKPPRIASKTLQKSLLRDFSSAVAAPCSPAHLHGDLKVEHKHGVSYIELSLAHSENVLVAKTLKAENALNSVYTFHSFPSRNKSNKDTPMVGQMQVSSHLCCGALSNSMMMEFVLYEGSPDPPEDIWTAEELHPSHEVAAVVIQVPFDKSNSTSIAVVTPLGNHSMPSSESRGPSSLLDRWRQGGGCECGGWDMACPLNVFDNLSTRCKGDQPVALYVKGVKASSPALAMKATRKGQYSVDFHAQLSAIQALAVCVAVLHAEVSSVVDREKNKRLLQLVKDEVKLAMKASEDHPGSFVLDPPFSPIARV